MSQWKCADGRVMDIKDMDTKHLSNSIALLRSRGVVSHEDVKAIKEAIPRMPEEEKREMVLAAKGMRKSSVLGDMEAELLRRFQSGESR